MAHRHTQQCPPQKCITKAPSSRRCGSSEHSASSGSAVQLGTELSACPVGQQMLTRFPSHCSVGRDSPEGVLSGREQFCTTRSQPGEARGLQPLPCMSGQLSAKSPLSRVCLFIGSASEEEQCGHFLSASVMTSAAGKIFPEKYVLVSKAVC